MDGNGRWAEARRRPRSFGHRAGVETVRRVVEDAGELGIPCLTLYSFSTENWTRPKAEIAALMALMKEYIEKDLGRLTRDGVRVRIIGTREGLRPDVLELIERAEGRTAHNAKLQLNIAFNYGGRDEILRAVRRAAASGADLTALSEDAFASFLDTHGQPDPDLVIRTSGEQRISNYLLWQAAYAEFVFTETLWPDFRRDDLVAALEAFTSRNRRFGNAVTSDVA